MATYTCGLYTKFEAAPGFATYGDCADYSADLSTSPQLGSDGRLRSDLSTQGGFRLDNTTPAGQKRALLYTHPDGFPRVRPGRYYWQAWRPVAGGYETSAVQSFTIKATVTGFSVSVPAKQYARYPITFSVRAGGVADGTPVVVERRSGSSWVPVRTLNLRPPTMQKGRGAPVGVLPLRTKAVRVSVQQGSDRSASAPAAVRVLAAKKWSTTRDGGRYAGGPRGQNQRLRIAAGGRELLGFSATISTSCVGPSTLPGQPIQTTVLDGVAPVSRAKISPDGRFYAVRRYAKDKTAVVLQGRVSGKRVTGRVDLEIGACSGGRTFSLRRTG